MTREETDVRIAEQEKLALVEPRVTGLGSLHGLAGLKLLSMRGTQVADVQIAALQKALPHVTIVR